MAKILRWAGLILGIAVVGAGAFMVYRIGPRNVIGMLRYDQREEGDLKVGDAAPDVVLAGLDGQPVHLKERFGGKPVVLVFGSYT
jgi:hypothetical protein